VFVNLFLCFTLFGGSAALVVGDQIDVSIIADVFIMNVKFELTGQRHRNGHCNCKSITHHETHPIIVA